MADVKCTLLISTFNWPQALELCFQSILKQTKMPDEIVIADDGSKLPTQEVIEKYKKIFSIPLIHVWQQDDGFRLAAIRNKAIAKSTTEYIIQIDGDVILHPEFIKDHIKLSKKGYFTTGSRGNIKEIASERIMKERELQYPSSNQLINKMNVIRIPPLTFFLRYRYKTKGKHRYFARGCNMAFWRSDLLKINGYNEEIVGWGCEDGELVVRLLNSGCKKQFIKFSGIVYHIWHKVASRDSKEANEVLLKATLDNKTIRCKKGIDQYL